MIYLANSNINPIQDGKEGGGGAKSHYPSLPIFPLLLLQT